VLISILLFLSVPIALKAVSTTLHTSFRDVAKALLVSLSIGLVLSSLISSLVYLFFPSFRWEDSLFLIAVLLTANAILGTYIYAILFGESYLSALRRNMFTVTVVTIITVAGYVLLLVFGLG